MSILIKGMEMPMDYTELVKSLRVCCTNGCDDCAYDTGNDTKCYVDMLHDAADAIETLEKTQRGDNALGQRWISAKERLPEEPGAYIVFLRAFAGDKELGLAEYDLSYATEMFFDKAQMLWVGEGESYNAILSAVDATNAYHVTHWMPLPEPPKEET